MRSCGVLQRPVTPSVQLPFVAFTSPFEPCAKPLELVHPLLPPLFAQLSLQLVNAGHGPEPGDRYVSSSHVPAVVTNVHGRNGDVPEMSAPLSVRLIGFAIDPSVRSVQLFAMSAPSVRRYGTVACKLRVAGDDTPLQSHAWYVPIRPPMAARCWQRR